MKEKKNGEWTNVSRLQTVKPKKYLMPESLADIVAAVKEAEKSNLRIRAVGAGHSSTDIAITPDILLDLKKHKRVFMPDKTQLHPQYHRNHLVHTDSGVTLHDMVRDMDKLGLALQTLGIVDDQTISGAIATGTHGPVKSMPGLPGLVRSMVLVADGGKIWRIEPKNGITNPAKHHEPGITLLQDDDAFRSLLVHLGAFGIIASYILEVEPQYWLYEKRTVEKWSEVRQQILDGTLYRDYPAMLEKEVRMLPVYGMNIALSPHEIDGDHTCMIGRFFRLAEKPSRGLLERTRSIGNNIVARTGIPFAVLVNTVNDHPYKVPKLLETALHTLNEESYINKSFKVWYQGLEFIADATFGSEFAYSADNHDWLQAVEAVIARFKRLAVEENIYSPNTLMIRYSQGSQAYLAAENGLGTVAWVGTPVPREMRKGMRVLEEFQKVNMQHRGRSHWGKMNNRVEDNLDLLPIWFPKLEVWKAQMRKFNPKGTFSNAFTQRFGLTD